MSRHAIRPGNPPGPKRLSALSVLLLSACIAGCTHTHPLAVDVPYVEQPPFECGVATLQMALQQQGVDYDPVQLRKRVFIPALNGTTIGVMAKAAQEFGATATMERGNNHLLAAWLDQGYSPIVMWGPKHGADIGHFVVVNAITTSHDKFRVHSGSKSDHWVPFRDFMGRWKEGGYRVLIINGPTRPTEHPTSAELSDRAARTVIR